jgi:phosphoribosylformylglycinamidine synthase subunit PurQ / glutaminase
VPKSKVKVLVLRTAGTNCNEETSYAFSASGAEVTQVHVNALISGEVKLADFHILALSGGFSYGDDIASGRVLANELRLMLGDDLKKFIKAGKLLVGICNGFQILVKAGILPGLGGNGQEATLFHNDSAKFEARWTHLCTHESKCIWTKGMPGQIYLPVAHGEGKFIPKNDKVLKTMKDNGQIVFSYCSADGGKPSYPDDPNGSTEHIAGICDSTGRILGLMPHPERHFSFEQHPSWTRITKTGDHGHGAQIFKNGVEYVKKNLL